MGLRSSEVQNQHFLNLDIGLPVDRLTSAIRKSLADHTSKEEIVLTARNRRGKEISCKIVITPLKGPQENVEGIILIIEEIVEPMVEREPGSKNENEVKER